MSTLTQNGPPVGKRTALGRYTPSPPATRGWYSANASTGSYVFWVFSSFGGEGRVALAA